MMSQSAFILYLVVVIAQVVFANAARFSPSQVKLVSNTVVLKQPAEQAFIVKALKKNSRIVLGGFKGLFTEFIEWNKVRKFMKAKGETALSFAEFKFLEKAQEDFSKVVRILFTVPLSPEFFFYSYLVFPMFSINNPWAWRSLPSSFDDVHDAQQREQAILKRRLQAVISSLTILRADTVDDSESNLRKSRLSQLQRIEKALQLSSNLEQAVKKLEDFVLCDTKQAKNLRANKLPPKVVKELCRCIGVDGVPNIPLLRRFNNGELNRYFQKLKKSDSFLSHKGLQRLSPSEIRTACIERGIGCANRGEDSLKQDLETWLHLTNKTVSSLGIDSKLGENEHDKRLALMALNVVRDFKTNDFSSTYRSLLK